MPKTLITGAASGIGRATAELLARNGHELALVDTGDLADVLTRHGGVTRIVGDVSSEDFWNDADPALAGLTHAVINAGVSSGGPIDQLDFAEWRRVMSVNLDGAFLTLRAALKAIKASSGSRALVLTGSIPGSRLSLESPPMERRRLP